MIAASCAGKSVQLSVRTVSTTAIKENDMVLLLPRRKGTNGDVMDDMFVRKFGLVMDIHKNEDGSTSFLICVDTRAPESRNDPHGYAEILNTPPKASDQNVAWFRMENVIRIKHKKRDFCCIGLGVRTMCRSGIDQMDKHRCHFCMDKRRKVKRNGKKLKKCKQCCRGGVPDEYIPRYCDKRCQKRDWKHHKQHCALQYYSAQQFVETFVDIVKHNK